MQSSDEASLASPPAPASPIFAAPFANSVTLSALPCSTDNPDWSCPQVHRLYAAAMTAHGPNGSAKLAGSLSDLYLRCRADKCVEQTRRLTAVSSAPSFMRKDLIQAAEALEDCGITACGSEFALAHSLVCVPLTHPNLAPALAWFRSAWSPTYIPPDLASAVAVARTPKAHNATTPAVPPPPPPTSLGLCSLSLPLDSPCDPEPVHPISGLPSPQSVARLARTAVKPTAPLLPTVLGDTLFIPKSNMITGLAAGQLAFPVNFYTPAPCPLGRVLSASPLGSMCTRPAECRLGTCPQPPAAGGAGMTSTTTACTRDIREPPGAFVADPGTAPLVLDPSPAIPTAPSASSVPPASSSPPGAGRTGSWFAIASILAPSILLMVFLMAYMHHRKLERRRWPVHQQHVAATRMLAEFPAQRRPRDQLPAYSPYPSRPPSYMTVSSASTSMSTASVVVVDVQPQVEDEAVPQRKATCEGESMADVAAGMTGVGSSAMELSTSGSETRP